MTQQEISQAIRENVVCEDCGNIQNVNVSNCCIECGYDSLRPSDEDDYDIPHYPMVDDERNE